MSPVSVYRRKVYAEGGCFRVSFAIWSETTWCNKIKQERDGDTHFVHMSILHNTPAMSWSQWVCHWSLQYLHFHCNSLEWLFFISVDDNCISTCLSFLLYQIIHKAYCDAIVCVEYKTKQNLFTCNSISLLLPWELTIMIPTERFRHSFAMIS